LTQENITTGIRVRETTESIAQVTADAEIIAIVSGQYSGRKSGRWKWPPGCNRVTSFNTDELTKMRLYKSERFSHERVEAGGPRRESCAL